MRRGRISTGIQPGRGPAHRDGRSDSLSLALRFLDAETVLAQLSGWIEDYNTRAPHAAMGMRSPAEYRAEVTLNSSR